MEVSSPAIGVTTVLVCVVQALPSEIKRVLILVLEVLIFEQRHVLLSVLNFIDGALRSRLAASRMLSQLGVNIDRA